MFNTPWFESGQFSADESGDISSSARTGPATRPLRPFGEIPVNYSNDPGTALEGSLWTSASSFAANDLFPELGHVPSPHYEAPEQKWSDFLSHSSEYPFNDYTATTHFAAQPSPTKRPRLHCDSSSQGIGNGSTSRGSPLTPAIDHCRPGDMPASAAPSAPQTTSQAARKRKTQYKPKRKPAAPAIVATPAAPAVFSSESSAQSSSAQYSASEALRKASSDIRRATVTGQRATTQTGPQYARYFKNYEEWWTARPDERQKLGIPRETSHMPITAPKVVLFLDYTRNRLRKNSNGNELDGRVGAATIIGIITALEAKRVETQDDFPNDRDALRTLRDDTGIRAIEAAAKHDRPKLLEEAMLLKASGTSADTYTTDDLHTVGRWYFQAARTPTQLQTMMRDRAMFFLGLAVAFRGDSTRNVQLSDLFLSDVSIPDIRPGFKVPVLGILADNAKHNQTGRVEEYALMRHREPLVCGVSAMAAHLFLTFRQQTPDFVPDFSGERAPVYGKRTWYSHLVFPADFKRPEKSLTYDAHNRRIHKMHGENNISLTKVTHAPRPTGVKIARENGASSDGTKALGGWHSGDSYNNCYDHTLPLDALLGISGQNGRKPETYHLPRANLDVPPELVAAVFPASGQWLTALNERESQSAHRYKDVALRNLLRLLPWLAKALVVDMALLLADGDVASTNVWFTLPPFNTDAFRRFASEAPVLLREAERQTRLALDKLPDFIAAKFQTVLSDMYVERRRETKEQLELISRLTEALDGYSLSQTAPCNPSGSSRTVSISSRSMVSTRSTRSDSPEDLFSFFPSEQPSPSQAGRETTLPPSASSSVAPSVPPSPLHDIVDFRVLDVVADRAPSPVLPEIRDVRAEDMAKLRARFDPARVARHFWTWVPAECIHLPSYELAHGLSIEDTYREWTEGHDGHLAVRSLEEAFGVTLLPTTSITASYALRMTVMNPTLQRLIDHHAQLANVIDAGKLSRSLRWLTKGKIARHGPGTDLVIGIDASSWLLVRGGETVDQYRERVCLAIAGLVDTTTRLLREGLTLNLLFVFDNPDCSHPRTRLLLHSDFTNETTPDGVYQSCVREVLERSLFCSFCREFRDVAVSYIVYRDSTLRATKELAQLTITGRVDVVLGLDFAALLFGARRFIKMPNCDTFDREFDGALDMYAATRLESMTGLSRGGLVLTVLLSAMGSNEPALELPFEVALAAGKMNRCSLGNELLRTGDILQDGGPAELAQALANWTTRLQFEIALDLHNVFGGRDLRRARRIPHEFPNRATVISYTVPVDPQAADILVLFSVEHPATA
ncbi:unnamed protein product [Peniophora sp. CBMAI 1063]|nr:unnamed protein product [Peniophora sp. CBMAI 1063]